MNFDVRPGAYAVIIDQQRVLLSLWSGIDYPVWTLPGGGIEWGEQPARACVREIEEETGFKVELNSLLGCTTGFISPQQRKIKTDRGLMVMRSIYRATIVSGSLRPEKPGGSSIDAGWIPLDRLDDPTVAGGHPVLAAVREAVALHES